MRRIGFWLRWSGRELRRRWVQVVVIALIVAVGTGVTAGLGSTGTWRRRSYDASYELLAMHDLRVTLTQGAYVPQGTLMAALVGMEHPSWIAAAEERLLATTQVDASIQGRAISVRGRIVGVTFDRGGPQVDRLWVTAGRGLTPADAERPAVLLEEHFASYYELPANGTLRLAGGTEASYVGAALEPEYFIVTDDSAGYSLMTESAFAVLFMPLESAQAASGHDGGVNDLVLRLAPDVDPVAARQEVRSALEDAMPGLGATVSTKKQDEAYRLLYGDIDSDEGTFDLLAGLVFVAAVFAAFNLTSRIVEAQRREIGIGMALGAPSWKLALRPMLIGAEIALLGVVFGIGMGILVGSAMAGVMADLLPMPIWETPFQVDRFVGAAALGVALPLLATAWPVWRAVRVRPIDAIRTGHLAARGGGLAPFLKRIAVPGGTFAQVPIRNVLRAPRRTIVTAVGIAATIMAMIALIGMIDSFMETLDRGEREVRSGAPSRSIVELTGIVPANAPVVVAVADADAVGAAEPVLRFSGEISAGDGRIAALLEVVDLQSPIWHPTLEDVTPADGMPGIVLADKAADDLGIGVGGAVALRHPAPTAGGPIGTTTTWMRVVATHPGPLRPFAYVDDGDAAALGLGGLVNGLQVTPAPGRTPDDLERELFALEGVASVQPASTTVDVLRDLMQTFDSMFRVIEVFVALLALLVAFNSASINVDERAREHATMFAFGLRLRTLLRMTGIEGLIVGLLGALVGLGLGTAAMRVLLKQALSDSPEVDIVGTVHPATMALAVAIGVLAAVLATLLTARKLRHMDVPSTLRVME